MNETMLLPGVALVMGRDGGLYVSFAEYLAFAGEPNCPESRRTLVADLLGVLDLQQQRWTLGEAPAGRNGKAVR
jgi:hypothetical protein